jgi:ferritin-like metal-binding protein YciE
VQETLNEEKETDEKLTELATGLMSRQVKMATRKVKKMPGRL